MGSTKEVDCHKSVHETRFTHEARNNEADFAQSSQEKRSDPRKVREPFLGRDRRICICRGYVNNSMTEAESNESRELPNPTEAYESTVQYSCQCSVCL
jgi:hypothetical protein